MNIYHYDKETGEYLGEDTADMCQIENVPIFPAFATQAAPPANVAKGKVAVFDEVAGTWSQVVDLRGKVYNKTTGEESMHSELGALPADLTSKAPAPNSKWDAVSQSWVDDPAKHAELKRAEIDVAYLAARDAGVTYKAALFQSDEKSVQSLVKVLTALANSWVLPAGFVWVDAANVAHPATKAWLQGLNKAFGDHEAMLFARKLQAKSALAVIDLTSPTAIADIQAIVF